MNPLLIAGAISKGKSFVWGLLKWLAILGFIGLAGWGLYAGLIRPVTKPNATTKQEAESITNYNYTLEPKQTFFGCSNFRIQKPEQEQKVKK